MQTSYCDAYQGGLKKTDTAIEYFKALIDILNYDYIPESAKSQLDPKNAKYAASIESITFYDGVVVIKKFKTPKEKSRAIVVGSEEKITPLKHHK